MYTMRPEGPQNGPVLVQWLHLLLIHFLLIHIVNSLSVSQATGNKNSFSAASSETHHHASRRHAPPPQPEASMKQLPSTLPPLLTTITQSNLIDSVLSKRLAKQQASVSTPAKQLLTTNNETNTLDTRPPSPSIESRASNVDEHEDSVPLATVNNHSRNSQHIPKPPQYVDVGALVGRNMSLGGSMSMGGMHSGAGTGVGGLSSYAAAIPGGSGLGKLRSTLPECATQQVCNAIFVRMNYTQKLCECSTNYNWKCSNNLDPQDGHTIELTRKFDKRIYTQIKTCEPLREVRACKSPTDWTLLALQSERSGKAHYVVVCKCPTWAQLEGPYTHNHPPYANIPGIRVYGMLCVHQTARSSAQSYATYNPSLSIYPEFPWSEALNVLNTTNFVPALQAS